jgi:hypothetical protein
MHAMSRIYAGRGMPRGAMHRDAMHRDAERGRNAQGYQEEEQCTPRLNTKEEQCTGIPRRGAMHTVA